MSRSFAEIVALYYERKQRLSPHIIRAMEVKDQYNGDVVVPLPELDANERPAVANILSQGLDQTAMRISSTQPNPLFPPLKPNIKKSEEEARQRRQATLAWWSMNKMKIQDRRRARQLIGYGAAPVMLRPNFDRSIPTWHVRDPLTTFAADNYDPDCMTPDDCIFTFYQPLKWLRSHYPVAANMIQRRPNERPDDMYELIEYVDGEVIVLGLLGAKRSSPSVDLNGAEMLELERIPNLAGVCTAVIPGRVNLDRLQGQFDGMLGLFLQQQKLQALAVIATERGIFKNEWLIARPGEVPKVIQEADGRHGITGQVQGGDLREVATDPSYMTNPMIDRLERYQRVEGGIPSEFGGESGSNIRTGRRGDAILSAVVDFPVQEAQEILAHGREEEDKRAIAIDKAYFGAKQKSFYINWKGENARVDYVPKELWTTDDHTVSFSHAGTDVNGLSILIGQLLGMGLMSKKYAMQTHPLIEDAERMHDEVIGEGLEQAVLAALQQQASQPGANLADIARISQLVVTNKQELIDAVLLVQKEAQERQATQDAQGNSTAVDPNSPEAQPGLAAPGQGAEAGTTAIQGPTPDMQNLANLLGSLRRPQMSLASEQPAQVS